MLKKTTFEEIKKKAELSNCVILTQEYVDVYQPLLCYCKIHKKEFYKKYVSARRCNNNWCPYCGKEKINKAATQFRIPIEEVRRLFKENNATLLDTNYVNMSTLLKARCDIDGTIFYRNLADIKRHRGCPTCKPRPKKILKDCEPDFLKKEFEKRNLIMLDEYQNVKQQIRYICNNHKGIIQTTTASNLFNKTACPLCTKENKGKEMFERVRNKCIQKNYTFIEIYYNDKNIPYLKYICNKHSDKERIIAVRDLNHGSSCYECGLDKLRKAFKFSYSFIKSEFEKEGYKLISKTYKNAHQELQYVCDKHPNIVQTTTYDYFKQGARCKYCVGASSGELKLQNYLEKNNIPFIKQKSFKDCKIINALCFDFAIIDNYTDRNILGLIEVDGAQHFEPVDFAGKGKEWATERFEFTQKSDNIKNEYCVKNNLELLRINYSNSEILESEVNDFIKDKCKLNILY